jgi:hypothetical protein
MTTEHDTDRDYGGGWVAVLESGGFAGAESVIHALVYARALASGSSVGRVLDDVRRELTRKTGEDADVIVGSSVQA